MKKKLRVYNYPSPTTGEKSIWIGEVTTLDRKDKRNSIVRLRNSRREVTEDFLGNLQISN